MELTGDIERHARVLVRDPNRRNRIVGWYFDAGTWEQYRDQIPEPMTVHPRVRPRYARWLAMLEVYMRSGSGVSGLSATELAVTFLPEDPETYYQLDNAAFELGLIDPFLARSLTWLARQKLEDGDHEECRRLLNLYLRIRPDSSDPVVTQGPYQRHR
jgi:hypothetical protein